MPAGITRIPMRTASFPVGYHDLHRIKILDYQLNRWYSLGYLRLEDIQAAAASIRGLADWKDGMVRLAEAALSEGRVLNATFLFRAAEFFVLPDDPDKRRLYHRFRELFYGRIAAGEPIEQHAVPYAGKSLPAIRVRSQKGPARGTLVVHGGFDSFMEELWSLAWYFADRGHDVVLFEGPGQGLALEEHRLPMTYQWEKPAKAVLDHLGLDDVTWMGISMGGWLCFRAAAFEPRIRRVVASSIAFDYLQIPPRPIQWFARFLFRFPRLLNWLAKLKAKRMPQERWGLYNMMYIFQEDEPAAASRKMLELNEENQHADRVRQDVLILTGAEDHFIPLKMHRLQVKALSNVASLTERIYTRAEQGHNHCQVGNFGLALDDIAGWIEEKRPR